MRVMQLIAAFALVAATSVSQAAVVTLVDTTITKASYQYTNWTNPWNVLSDGKYSFNLTITPTATNAVATLTEFILKNNDILLFDNKILPINGIYKFSQTFDLKKGDVVRTNLAFNLLQTSKLNTKVNFNVSPVPEPETYALMGLGLVGILAARRRKMGKLV